MNRESFLEKAIEELHPLFKKHGGVIPKNIKVTCGWPTKSAGRSNKRTVGQCIYPQKPGGNTELIVSMVVDDTTTALDILCHELVHASLGAGHGHKAPFRRLALAIGLTGKMTATVAGPELVPVLKEIEKKLGKYPHSSIDFDNRKKQTTRMIKVKCTDDECGCVFRTSAKWIKVHKYLPFSCPICFTDCEIS